MKHLVVLLAKWKTVLMAFVKPLGIWGAGLVAAVDAAFLPLPMDLIMAGYAWANRQDFYLYAILLGAGSALGALVPYLVGRAGGELFLLRRIDRARFDRVRERFERQEFVAMMIPSAMPPPTPWKLFVFGAGVFEMKVPQFLLSVFLGRTVRYLIEGVLTVLYGPRIIVLFERVVKAHLVLLLVAVCLVMGLVIWWAIQRQMRKKTD